MKRDTLLDIDPDFRDPAKLREWLIQNVATSTAIETGASVQSISKDLRAFAESRSGYGHVSPLTIEANRRRIGS